MGKAIKKLLVFFILLCVIVIIVYAVEVFVVNRDSDDTSDPQIADTSPPELSDTSPPDDTRTTPPSETNTPPPEETDGTQGTEKLFEIPLPGGRTLMLRADETLFKHEMLDMTGDLFTYTQDGTASLEISFIDDTDALMLAPGFLDNYIDYTGGEFFVEGESRLGQSGIFGDLVIAKKDGVTFEAWLLDIENGVLAFVINYHDDALKTELVKILDSVEIIAS